jgi:myo-inositol 2-dehydrogenase / D-chiro-inositol 1-dehydrogenase
MNIPSERKLNRREFLGSTAAASFMIMKPSLVRGTAANSTVRFGLLGCGNRGSTDCNSMMTVGNACIVALADLFQDKLDAAKTKFDEANRSKGFPPINTAQMFRGPHAYEQIANSKEVDALIIATPSYYHPEHLEAAVEAGKHVYCEKPAGIDVPATNRVLETGAKVEGRFTLAIGLEFPYATPVRELVNRVKSGQAGKIAYAEAYYYAPPMSYHDYPNASRGEQKIRNFFHWTDLCGGQIVDQGIHPLDMVTRCLQSHPVKAAGTGFRKVLDDPGDVWDVTSVIYTYPDDATTLTYSSTWFDRGWWDVCERLFGDKGTAEAHYSGPLGIFGKDSSWSVGKPPGAGKHAPSDFSASGIFHSNIGDADTQKAKEFLDSITSGHYPNEAEYGVEVTRITILGRMAAQRHREVTWEEMLRSSDVLDPHIDLNQLA